ncbi:MAG: S8 family serine peptidase [Bacteroidia bacterium]|nr:S8 family serine peptidase [Bacteroidia bacterium]
MKKILLFFLVLIIASCAKDDVQIDAAFEPQIVQYDRSQINNFISQKTSKGKVFDWSSAEPTMIHSAAMLSDSIMAIGYQVTDAEPAETFIGKEQKLSDEWLDQRNQTLLYILQEERKARNNPQLQMDDLLPFELDDAIPTLAIQMTSRAAIETLSNDNTIRYIEPMGYEYTTAAQKSGSGCGSAPDYSINTNDYVVSSSFNAKIPWNFYNHNIPDAWDHSTGDNIGICIIDTGASDNQNNLGSQFASGNSGGRYISKKSTKYSGTWWWKSKDSPHDQCGHGTSMAGLAAAPWSTDGNALGVAYKANLITVRAVEDVIISSSNEKNGVKDALKLAGNRSDVKIASMSIGNIISSGTVKDGVYYAYNRGKLLLAAAGTSTSFTNWVGVIFPASMNQTTAITGVKAQSSYSRCNTCHSGSKVDFTIQMQRSYDSGRNSLALALTGNQPDYISGSSCATATTAGIAALVWATNPSMSRSQVVNRLKVASQKYPNRSSSYGWGNINAKAAVLGQSY